MTFALYEALSIILLFALIFSNPLPFYFLIILSPQAILIPIFITFYIRDQRKIERGELVTSPITPRQVMISLAIILVLIITGLIIIFPKYNMRTIPLMKFKDKTGFINKTTSCYSFPLINDFNQNFINDDFTFKYPYFFREVEIPSGNRYLTANTEFVANLVGGDNLPFTPNVTIQIDKVKDSNDDFTYFENKTLKPCDLAEKVSFPSVDQALVYYPDYPKSKNIMDINCHDQSNQNLCSILIPQLLLTLSFK